jgi:hypothetical protein
MILSDCTLPPLLLTLYTGYTKWHLFYVYIHTIACLLPLLQMTQQAIILTFPRFIGELSIPPFNRTITSFAVVQSLAIAVVTTKRQLILLTVVPLLDSISPARLPSRFPVILIQQRLTGSSWQYLQQQAGGTAWIMMFIIHFQSCYSNIVSSTTVFVLSVRQYTQVQPTSYRTSVFRCAICSEINISTLTGTKVDMKKNSLMSSSSNNGLRQPQTYTETMYPFPINNTLEHAWPPESSSAEWQCHRSSHTFSLFQPAECSKTRCMSSIIAWSDLFTSQYFLQPRSQIHFHTVIHCKATYLYYFDHWPHTSVE